MGFSNKENNFILSLYKPTGGCSNLAREIAESELRFSIPRKRVLKLWAESGLQINYHGGYRTGVSRDSFLCIYKELKGDFKKIQDFLQLTPEQLINIGYKQNIGFLNRPKIFSKNPRKLANPFYGRFNTKGRQINTKGQTFLN